MLVGYTQRICAAFPLHPARPLSLSFFFFLFLHITRLPDLVDPLDELRIDFIRSVVVWTVSGDEIDALGIRFDSNDVVCFLRDDPGVFRSPLCVCLCVCVCV